MSFIVFEVINILTLIISNSGFIYYPMLKYYIIWVQWQNDKKTTDISSSLVDYDIIIKVNLMLQTYYSVRVNNIMYV